ncbi:ABC transporter ATP-binding protein [Kibdelosporangium phytohabitans]|uniref:Peptide ABC transporter ATP-binding protein n=1 Tax=Kibdelosporangium phytohabitans TaxID=860235 RepID=A0A0N9I401_9PSEU|nr:ABC transporter ATP-binding protein [Kibdelosporangium phytohabitans]ALG10632.1 peptide ABC transporter ATP-binding protein [Kibdelosporangium phytohabitans]MBE1461751.1 peptide/nickel transport system ATP-binding protein [Kibdelosporangium phytohabitans]
MTAVTVSGLRIDLDGYGVDVVDCVDFAISAGEVLGLVGESGSGKTTVGLALLGDARRGARIVGGRVLIDGQDVVGLGQDELTSLRGSTVAYVPQDPSMALNPALRLGAQLAELFEFHQPDVSAPDRDERIRTTLREVGLDSDDAFLDRYPHQLSGGQQQRITLALAFVLRPRVIVLDEPTTGLDVTTQALVLRTIRELCAAHQVAALYVTHDMAVVADLADRILVMYAGRVVESGASKQIFDKPVHPYTRALLAAVPVVSQRRELLAIPGDTPSPGRRPTGCAFHPRCVEAVPECATAALEPIEVGDGHAVRCIRAEHLAAGPARTAPRAAVAREPVDDNALLRVSHLDAHHGRRQILHDVSLELAGKECLALVGESGCGKTTLARSIIGLHHRHSGGISLRGTELATRARDRPLETRRAVQYIFQSPYNSLNPRRTIGETLREPLKVLFSMPTAKATATIAETLERVSLAPSMASSYPNQLSGGERQRVAIARALVCRPEVLICDEITSALDVSVQASIVRLLRELQDEEGLALLFVTHNLALVRTVADRVIAMRAGRLVEAGRVDDVLDHPGDPFTRKLIAATPEFPAAPTTVPSGEDRP